MRRFLPVLLRFADAVVVLALGLLALFRFGPSIVQWGHSLAEHLPSSSLKPQEKTLAIEAAVPTATYFVAGMVFLFSVGLAALVLRLLGHPKLRRFDLRRMTPLIVGPALVVSLVARARHVAHFWTWGALALIVGLAPAFVTRRTREPLSPQRGPALESAVVLGAELGCLFVGILLPSSETAGALLVPAFALGFGAGASFAAADPARADVLSRAALPLLLLPFFGLGREPKLSSELGVLVLVGGLWAVGRWVRGAGTVMSRARDCWGVDLALTATAFLVVLPFRFRDLAAADSGGHESQHLGWINSIAHGRWMMADAGFIYGPLREYFLAFFTWSLGGLTLEHVRLAHVTVNVLGLLLLLAAARRVAGKRLGVTALAGVLLVSHSAIVAMVNYTNTIAFGWVDELRAGLATLSVALALTRASVDDRWRLRIAGGVGALAILYSHDFGLLAAFATCLGLASERFARDAPGSTRDVGRRVGDYVVGVGAPLLAFILIYAVAGRGRALYLGLRWSFRVGAGLLSTAVEPYPVTLETFADDSQFFFPRFEQLGTSTFDYVVVPAIPIAGLAAAIATGIVRGWSRRNAMLFGLSAFAALTMRHPLVSADGWHIANAGGPAIVVVAALVHEAGNLRIPRGLRIGSVLAGAFAAAWLFLGAGRPLGARLLRLANSEERPSFGATYMYADLPRTGDILVEEEHLALSRWALQHSQPGEPVLSTTWLLGGGIESFLADRRNAVPYDVPHECQTDAQRAEAFEALRASPPPIIVGGYFVDFGPDTEHWVTENYTFVSLPGVRTPVYERRPPQ